jgi:integrase
MGTVFKQQVTRPLPPDATIFTRKGKRFARWRDGKGRLRTAAVTTGEDGTQRIVTECPYYFARYRDGSNTIRVKATGCRDETAARQVLATLERQGELVRSNVVTAAEQRQGEHNTRPLSEHLDAFDQHLQAKGNTAGHRTTSLRYLRELVEACDWTRLSDLRRESFERWLAGQIESGRSARSRNGFHAALMTFCNWCLSADGRMSSNPFARIPKANEETDPRRQRRAMTETELVKLLTVARERPYLDALTVWKGKRKGERYAKVRPEVRERLELVGHERALLYKTLVLTGLRKGELGSLTVAQLQLDGELPCIALDAADEKSREGNVLPLRSDLAADLSDWLAGKLARLQAAAIAAGSPIPARLPPDTPLFDVPAALVKILDRDLRAAGIAKRDERGRTLDVHALRTTFGTLLSKGGVSPRTAQEAMRHSKIELTMKVYTDPKLLDVGQALKALPALPLNGKPAGSEEPWATGTEGRTDGR